MAAIGPGERQLHEPATTPHQDGTYDPPRNSSTMSLPPCRRFAAWWRRRWPFLSGLARQQLPVLLLSRDAPSRVYHFDNGRDVCVRACGEPHGAERPAWKLRPATTKQRECLHRSWAAARPEVYSGGRDDDGHHCRVPALDEGASACLLRGASAVVHGVRHFVSSTSGRLRGRSSRPPRTRRGQYDREPVARIGAARARLSRKGQGREISPQTGLLGSHGLGARCGDDGLGGSVDLPPCEPHSSERLRRAIPAGAPSGSAGSCSSSAFALAMTGSNNPGSRADDGSTSGACIARGAMPLASEPHLPRNSRAVSSAAMALGSSIGALVSLKPTVRKSHLPSRARCRRKVILRTPGSLPPLNPM
jgi:hypothetical protein